MPIRNDPYFGGALFTLWYDRGLRHVVIAPFDIALVGVDLTQAELSTDKQLSETMLDAARNLERYGGMPRSPFPTFIAAVAVLAAQKSNLRLPMRRQGPLCSLSTATRWLSRPITGIRPSGC